MTTVLQHSPARNSVPNASWPASSDASRLLPPELAQAQRAAAAYPHDRLSSCGRLTSRNRVGDDGTRWPAPAPYDCLATKSVLGARPPSDRNTREEESRWEAATAKTRPTPEQTYTAAPTKTEPADWLGCGQPRLLPAVCGRPKQHPSFDCPGCDKRVRALALLSCLSWLELWSCRRRFLSPRSSRGSPRSWIAWNASRTSSWLRAMVSPSPC